MLFEKSLSPSLSPSFAWLLIAFPALLTQIAELISLPGSLLPLSLVIRLGKHSLEERTHLQVPILLLRTSSLPSRLQEKA
jgi:hypothetical protein